MGRAICCSPVRRVGAVSGPDALNGMNRTGEIGAAGDMFSLNPGLGDALNACHRRLNQAPCRPREPFWLNGLPVGSVVGSAMAAVVATWRSPSGARLVWRNHAEGPGLHLDGDPLPALAELALALHGAGLSGAWRHELLTVLSPTGQPSGAIERAAVRVLGIATQAVHLTGHSTDGRVWMQLRAHHKPNDPGLWDTMVGGLVAHTETGAVGAGDPLYESLARETWEEAGLVLPGLQALMPCGEFEVSRTSPDGAGNGHMRERIHWYHCTVPNAQIPSNQDGEVQFFELAAPQLAADRIVNGQCTDEAAWIFALSMGWSHA